MKWFTEKLGALKDKVKDLLKIGSPSKVYADEIGEMLPKGIVVGIDNGMNELDAAVNDMALSLLPNNATVASTYQSVSSNDSLYNLLATYLPIIANKDVSIKLEGGMDRFFRAMQTEARRNYQLTGAAL